ncbi:MAG: HAMP domain-containing sensor histidine kinase [Actinobacteria bacterium]|nr:HAMP domain-containing sensor histidine kinase [Actinomycetota bacterium]
MLGALLGLTILVLLVHDIPLASYLRNVENDRIITSLERDGLIIVGNAHEAVEEPNATNQADLEKALNSYRDKSKAVVIVTNEYGIVFASTDKYIAVGEDFSTRPEIAKALSGQVATGRRFSNTLNYQLLYIAVPMVKGEKVYGSVRITFPASVVDGIVNSRLRGLAAVAGITLFLAIIIALLLATSITRRLDRLRNVTEEFTAGNHEVRADSESGASEIRSLSTSFNNMADQLTTLINVQRSFAGDASHQLRTPLTALQLRLERATELIESDPAAATERLNSALVETQRLQNIVEGLLVLSRAENQATITPAPIEISQIVQERLTHWEALAAESNVTLQSTSTYAGRILAIQGVIEQVIDNYIDNALHVSPAGSTITVSVTNDDGHTTIHVVDEGPGMLEVDLERAFNRFWRAQSDEHGSGLGLAIVERLVQACAGSVQLINVQPHGIDAQATFKDA